MNERDLEQPVYQKRPLLKAIKLHCLSCCGGQWEEVKKCVSGKTCFLHPYRLGKNPYHTLNLSDEQKQAISERMKKLHENK